MNTRQEEAALVRKILDEPANDEPRMAYADWLDEHGTPARHARAELIRLQVTRAEGGREKECESCRGIGVVREQIWPDALARIERGSVSPEAIPPITEMDCPKCGGKGKVADTSISRQRAVAESLRKEEAILRRWGAKWLPREIRVACRSFVWKGSAGVMTALNNRQHDYIFDRGWPAFLHIDAIHWLGGDPSAADVGLRFRSILAACPVERITVFGSAEFKNLTFKFDRIPGGMWSAYVSPIVGTASRSALISFDNRRDLVRGVVGFVIEFLPMARLRSAMPYSREYYEQLQNETAAEPLPPMTDEELERDAEARNNVDMPHER